MKIDNPSIKERLWHGMRSDLARYFPDVLQSAKLMCCACARFLSFDEFTLEHIIPHQSLQDDPPEVKRAFSANQRSGNLLLCSKPLKVKGQVIHSKGCNSLKGKFYDPRLREVFNRSAFDATKRVNRFDSRHHVSLFCAAYLAMVRHYGYQIALTHSGLLLRQQFFSPTKFLNGIPPMCQIVLFGDKPTYKSVDDLVAWSKPFTFAIEEHACLVIMRGLALRLPLSRDPGLPIARHLLIKPARYTLRPDFSTVFE